MPRNVIYLLFGVPLHSPVPVRPASTVTFASTCSSIVKTKSYSISHRCIFHFMLYAVGNNPIIGGCKKTITARLTYWYAPLKYKQAEIVCVNSREVIYTITVNSKRHFSTCTLTPRSFASTSFLICTRVGGRYWSYFPNPLVIYHSRSKLLANAALLIRLVVIRGHDGFIPGFIPSIYIMYSFEYQNATDTFRGPHLFCSLY